MAKAKAEITIFNVKDVKSVTRFYLLQSSTATAPSKPTTITPGGNWKTTEPSYTDGSTNTLYFVDLTIMSDGKTFSYSDVSKSSSYEAAKSAWNKANNAQNTANSANNKAQGIADNIYTPKTTTIDGGKITTGSIKAGQIDVANLFAQEIIASGSISGATIKGASGEFTKDFSVKTLLKESDIDNQNIFFQIINNADGVFIGIKSQEQANAYLSLTALGSVLAAQSLKLNGNGVSITAQKGMTLDGGTGISIPCEVSAGDNIRCGGDYYHNGNRIGETTTGIKDNTSIKQAVWANTGASVTLPAGVYMMVGTVRFESCKAGRLGVRFATGGVSYDQMTTLIPGLPTSAARTNVQVQWIMNVTKDTKYDLQAFQSSSAAVSCSSWIKAVRIS